MWGKEENKYPSEWLRIKVAEQVVQTAHLLNRQFFYLDKWFDGEFWVVRLRVGLETNGVCENDQCLRGVPWWNDDEGSEDCDKLTKDVMSDGADKHLFLILTNF